MSDQAPSDLYELLELSPNASFETIERMFRFHAKRYHPDAGASGNVDRFKRLVHAYEILRDPAKRTAYDAAYQKQQRDNHALVMNADATADDYAIRYRLLSLFYAQRRRNMKQPGMGIAKLEELTQLPSEILELHLWYFREKGWVQREVSGLLSITVVGVDEIEARERSRAAASTDTRLGYNPSASAISVKSGDSNNPVAM